LTNYQRHLRYQLVVKKSEKLEDKCSTINNGQNSFYAPEQIILLLNSGTAKRGDNPYHRGERPVVTCPKNRVGEKFGLFYRYQVAARSGIRTGTINITVNSVDAQPTFSS
jgi:hypothetical protein